MSQYQDIEREQAKVSDVHDFHFFRLVTNMKVAESWIIYSACTIIVSRKRQYLLAQWLACQTVDPKDKDKFPGVHLFFIVFLSSFFSILMLNDFILVFVCFI